jgi:hypothetical protein
MFGRAQFFQNSSAHSNGKSAKEGIIVKEGTFLETMGFGLAKCTDGCLAGVMRTKFSDDKIVMAVKLLIGECRVGIVDIDTEHGVDVAMVGVSGRLVAVACGCCAKRRRCLLILFQRTIRIGEVVCQSNGKRTSFKEVSLGGILTVETRYLGEVFGLTAGLNKTVNHVVRSHVIISSQENGAETDGV